jgi:hypothetical protein
MMIFTDAYLGERVMGFPNLTENIIGFIENDVRKMSVKIQGKDLLVIHGTADSMVLLHNSMALFRSLILSNVMFHEMVGNSPVVIKESDMIILSQMKSFFGFCLQIYPDEGHGLNGVISHMHSAMESFLQDAFGVAYSDEDQVTSFLAAAGFG